MDGAPDRPRDAALSADDRQILDFERRWLRHAAPKEQAIREQFGLSAARYYQVLGRVIRKPAAIAYDPMLVGRLQRTRDDRVRARLARTRPRDAD